MILLLVLGCACAWPDSSPEWTPVASVAPFRIFLDLDADGLVDADEYERTRWKGPPYATVDADHDGDASASEILTLFQAQSPTSFDGVTDPDGAAPLRPPWSIPVEQRDVWQVLVWMGDALRSRGQPGPDPQAVDAAVLTGRIDSPQTMAVLDFIRPQWLANGWSWPSDLP